MKRIQIFKAGTHTTSGGEEITFTETDLAAIAAAYDPALHEAPGVVGHPKSDGPSYLWATGLQAEGDCLFADVDQVDPAFSEMVTAGRFKKISAAFYRPGQKGNPRPDGWYLRHIGFLGAQPPAVKGLKPVQFGEGEEFVEFGELPVSTLAFTLSRIAGLFGRFRDYVIEREGAEKADVMIPAWQIEDIASASVEIRASQVPTAISNFSETEDKTVPNTLNADDIKKREAELTEREADVKKREEAVSAKAAEFSETETKQRRADHAAFLDSLVASGRPLPAPKDSLVEFMEVLAGQESSVEFAEGDQTVKAELLSFFKERVLGKLAKQVEFSEFAPGQARPDATDPAAIATAARAHQAEQAGKGIDISIADAVRAVTA
ncbi:MAG: peptidase [Alphaproteobacteria bacterium]|nr:peptidase [Alphaproteobacteria bacterium]